MPGRYEEQPEGARPRLFNAQTRFNHGLAHITFVYSVICNYHEEHEEHEGIRERNAVFQLRGAEVDQQPDLHASH